jgi:hypothetical protein
VSLFTALLLQALLKLTIALEERIAAFFNARRGVLARVMGFFGAAGRVRVQVRHARVIDVAFGNKVEFGGLLALIVVVLTMLAAEAAIVRFYRRLA